MGGPAWLSDALAAVMLVIAAYDLGRLATVALTGRRSERDVDAFHVAMGISMAAMLTNDLTAFSRDACAVLFGCTTVWFALRLPWTVAHRVAEPFPVGHRLVHLVSSGAMVYMLLALPMGPGDGLMRSMSGSGPGTDRLPYLAALLAVLLLAAAVGDADRSFVRRGRRPLPASAPGVPARLRLELSLLQGGSTPTTNLVETRPPPARVAEAAPFLAPRLAAASQVVMGLVMVYMLATMV